VTQSEAKAAFAPFRKPIFYAGLALICFGTLALLGLAYTAYQIVVEPESVPIINMFLASLNPEVPLLTIDAAERQVFFVGSETLHYLFLGFLGLMLVSVGVSVANGLIVGGMRLVAISKPEGKA